MTRNKKICINGGDNFKKAKAILKMLNYTTKKGYFNLCVKP